VNFLDLFPYVGYGNWDPRKAEITLEDALTMRLGIEWDEWSLPYTNGNNDLVFLNSNNSDWAKALLDLPLIFDPGSQFAYNTAATNAIGQALENATGEPMAQFANIYLFYPMQITDADWATTPTGLPIGGSGLYLKTRDLAKFGQLYLDGGVWQGQQLISAAWVADSVVPHVDVSSIMSRSDGYGYQWWLDGIQYRNQLLETWITAGYGGQYTFIIPGLELVVAFTGRNYENGAGVSNLYNILQWQIMDAIN
jgi:CubicO group peptidase (beta-lactamase class C family)